ncbi:MAG: NAD(P)-dependent oxidoreductase [Acidobacteria bacterium]|nr:NAD(P)-dependent oxidoreductase [Acidobacteriota bacterium]
MSDERFLVTGSGGCIGAWAVAALVREGTAVVAFDVSDDDHRLRLVLDDAELAGLVARRGDIRDPATVEQVVEEEGITHILHLAALQIPFCQADPVLGSQVNVTGTVNVFEAARRSDGRVRGVSYASSVAVFGPAAMYAGGVAGDDSVLAPTTLYGAFKQANEWTARMYAADWGVGSVGLRPCIVYGPGRDQGLTSAPTKAMIAAAVGKPSHIPFGGSSTFQHAADVAACFVAAARLELDSAAVHNMSGPSATIAEVAAMITEAVPGAVVSFDDDPLPLPDEIDGSGIDRLLDSTSQHRPLAEGIAGCIADLSRLIDAGLVGGSA